MGLFDFMNTGDPEKDSMIREGLLQFGLGLMSSRGRTLPAIGNAGRQSLSAMDAYKQRQFQGKLNDYQLKQLQQAEALSKLPGKYITPGSPEVQGNNPSAYTPAVPESMDLRGLANAYMAAPGGLPTGLQLQSMLKKDAPQFHSLAPGARDSLLALMDDKWVASLKIQSLLSRRNSQILMKNGCLQRKTGTRNPTQIGSRKKLRRLKSA